MQRMTREGWMEQFRRLESTFPAAGGKTRGPETAREYFLTVEQFDARTIEQAVTRLIGNSEFFPKPARLVAAAHAVRRERTEPMTSGDAPGMAESRARWQRECRERYFALRESDPVAFSRRQEFQRRLTDGVLCPGCYTGEPGWAPNPDCGECGGSGWEPSGGGSAAAARQIGGGLWL